MLQQCCSLVLNGKSREGKARFDAPGLGCASEHQREVAEPEGFCSAAVKAELWEQGGCGAAAAQGQAAEQGRAVTLQPGGCRAGESRGRGCWPCGVRVVLQCRGAVRGRGRERRELPAVMQCGAGKREGKLCCRCQSSGRIWARSKDCLDAVMQQHNSSGHSPAAAIEGRSEATFLRAGSKILNFVTRFYFWVF